MFKDKFKSEFAKIRQRGQVAVLFALLMPIFLMFTGATLDLGWYYLNVSRLQNAADAAAIAGAYELRDRLNTLEDANEVPLKYKATLVNKYPGGEPESLDDITKGVAKEYIDKNFSGASNEPIINAYKADENFYFVVKLEEKIAHLFLPFDPMNALVTAVARISQVETQN